MGLLFVTSEPTTAMEEELNEWYEREHIPERLSIEGFVGAKRFTSAARARRYLALYDLTHVDVLQSEQYQAFAGENFTPWTKRVVPRSNFQRTEAVQIYPGGVPTVAAARLLVLRFTTSDEAAVSLIQEGATTCFLGNANVAQLRIFAGHGVSAGTYFILVAGLGNLESLIDLHAFGSTFTSLDLMETFLLYT
jgi:hypothetical protein